MRDRLHIRAAGPMDAPAMARLLNAIIARGGTTAMTEPVAAEELAARVRTPGAAWHIAETEEALVGFQWIESADFLPPEAADIATFTEIGRTGLGIGSALFSATEAAARRLGYAWINANIRADNSGGLAYYQSRGFRIWRRVDGVEIAPGQIVSKIWKRYDLD